MINDTIRDIFDAAHEPWWTNAPVYSSQRKAQCLDADHVRPPQQYSVPLKFLLRASKRLVEFYAAMPI